MSDPTFTTADYLKAEIILDHLGQQLALEFAINGESFDRATMVEHVVKRRAINLVRGLLLDEGERIL